MSDAHLGAAPSERERDVAAFLEYARRNAGSVVINGDLFDFWFEYRSVILREHFRVVAKLAEVVEAGVPVTFVGGNHDAWAGSFLRDEVGVALVDGPAEMTLGGRRALVAHGDGLGKGDFKYRALKAVIRSPVSVAAFRALHPDLGRRVANLASSTEHKAEHGDAQRARTLGRAAFIQEWAADRMRENPAYELVVAGHSHVPAVAEIFPGRFYVNGGDWIRSRQTYLVLPPDGGAPELRDWAAGGKAVPAEELRAEMLPRG